MKNKRDKTITKFPLTKPKTYGYRVQKDDHKIESSEFIKTNGVRKSASKDLTFHDFEVLMIKQITQ